MKLLIVGSHDTTFALLQQVVDPRHVIIHCTDGAQALAALVQECGSFDLIVLESRAAAGEGAEVAGAVRAMGYDVPIVYFSLAGVDGVGCRDPWRSTLVCAIERASRGRRVLNCLLETANPEGWRPTAADILLEYAAEREKRSPKRG